MIYPHPFPLVDLGQRDPLVSRVREAMNVRGDDLLDASLAELLRAVQLYHRIEISGNIDYATLDVLGISQP